MRVRTRLCDFLRVYVVSPDACAAVAALLVTALLLPAQVKIGFSAVVFSASLSAFAILFAVFFAALATIASAGDDEFTKFLDLSGHLADILSAFKVALCALFLSLVYALIMFTMVELLASSGVTTISKWWVTAFSPLASYSLFASYLASRDTIEHARLRAAYLRIPPENRADYLRSVRDGHKGLPG